MTNLLIISVIQINLPEMVYFLKKSFFLRLFLV